jgi:hypothetical protein
MTTVSTLRRVPVPVDEQFRQIAKSERRSIAQQAQIVLEQFCANWPAKAGGSKPHKRETISQRPAAP